MLIHNTENSELFIFNAPLSKCEIFNNFNSETFTIKKAINILHEFNKVYYHNADSIFIFHKRTGRFKIIDINGHLVDSFLVPLIINNTPFSIYYNSSHNIIYHNHILYLTVFPVVSLNDFYNFPIEIQFDLITQKILSHHLKFPDNYIVGREWGGIGRSNAKCLGHNGAIVHSFSVFQPFLTIRNSKIKLEKIKTSKYLMSFPPEYYIDSMSNDSKYVFGYAATIGYYSDFFFDKYRNYYCRLVAHKNEIDRLTGVVPDYLDRNWSIMLFDHNFKFLGETFFEGGKYDFHHLLFTEQGLWVLSKNIQKINEDYLYTYHLMTYN